jgi:pimeloyl-ACP methyl ester carboxylesterase
MAGNRTVPLCAVPVMSTIPAPVPDADATIHWEATGPAEGRPVVFIHGVRENRQKWRPQMPLADSFRVVTLDLPAHGTQPAERFRLERAVDQVCDVIDEAGDRRALVVGFSLGGYVAMELAARSPQRVAGLMICGASSEPWTVVAAPLRLAARLLLAVDEGVSMPWAAARTGRAALGRRLDPTAAPTRRKDRIDAGGQALLDIAGRRFRPRLRAYKGPTLIVNGARDRVMRRHELAFVRECRQGRIVILPDAGHLASIEAPDAFNALVREFADTLPW